ncbi:hypothetical protein QFZ28_003453 [Neobacillus niacini]|nr:hypothetical protein [Neobacillus niacini]MDQ1003053.1 hypothetical protein [Neobacillus niacini]
MIKITITKIDNIFMLHLVFLFSAINNFYHSATGTIFNHPIQLKNNHPL